MVTLTYNGRLGNNIIQYITAFLFAKKNNFFLNCKPKTNYGDFGEYFKLPISDGQIKGEEIVIVNDENYIKLFESKNLEIKHYHFEGFFQDKIFLEKYRKELLSLFELNYQKKDTNQVFVHYRIGDIIDDRRMLPIEYFYESLDKINPIGGYISSENLSHKFCIQLMKKYNLVEFQSDPLSTLNFAKNFDNIVLSEGTFSWLIGFLSSGKNIFCNERNYKWHGDINFSFWNKLGWDYDQSSIYNSRFLSYYSPTKLK